MKTAGLLETERMCGLGQALALKVGIEPTPTAYRDTDRLSSEDLRICKHALPNPGGTRTRVLDPYQASTHYLYATRPGNAYCRLDVVRMDRRRVKPIGWGSGIRTHE